MPSLVAFIDEESSLDSLAPWLARVRLGGAAIVLFLPRQHEAEFRNLAESMPGAFEIVTAAPPPPRAAQS